ncbi:MAG: lactate dehydrogenase [Candidatus Binatia bacterium]|nr:MAG: lactate dehydrogenase [Candidatus Binatia bacterium]
MKVAFFGSKPYEREFFDAENRRFGHQIVYLEPRLDESTAVLAASFPAVCIFVHDRADERTLGKLAAGGTRLLALRCAGYNNVDLRAAERAGITVVRVPAYSPHAVAEHTIALLLALDRKIHRAYLRVREGNFALDGLMGFDLHGRTAGVVGTGRIGGIVARLLRAFGCRVLAYDPIRDPQCENAGVEYTDLPELLARSEIVTLHCPLTPETYHLVDRSAVEAMRPGVFLVNTGRGALVDTRAIIEGLKSGKIAGVALDVYEEEEGIFYEDLSDRIRQDDVLARLLTFPNVIVTAHQAFFTREAMEAIARTTLENIATFARGEKSGNEVTVEVLRA